MACSSSEHLQYDAFCFWRCIYLWQMIAHKQVQFLCLQDINICLSDVWKRLFWLFERRLLLSLLHIIFYCVFPYYVGFLLSFISYLNSLFISFLFSFII
jgi:hypothetical protein